MAPSPAHSSNSHSEPQLEPGWRDALLSMFDTPGAGALHEHLNAEAAAGHAVFPPAEQRYTAFERTPLADVRVVIVGQDPYHGPGQAMGLSFSVPRGVPVPPSLRNIFTELGSDLGVPRPEHGDLSHWSDQGVLLLNSALSVRAHEAGSHASIGWEPITDAAIHAVSARREHVVFLLWGRHAQTKAALIDDSKHLVLRAPHPSPLSASKGFFGCRHFSQANAYLQQHGHAPVDWAIPD